MRVADRVVNMPLRLHRVILEGLRQRLAGPGAVRLERLDADVAHRLRPPLQPHVDDLPVLDLDDPARQPLAAGAVQDGEDGDDPEEDGEPDHPQARRHGRDPAAGRRAFLVRRDLRRLLRHAVHEVCPR